MLETDWPAVKKIYEEGLATGHASFQTTAPEWREWNESHSSFCRLIAIENDKVVGWAALTPVSGRCVYAGVGEVSVYVGQEARSKGIGKILLKALIDDSEKNNFWTLQSGIFPENKSSIHIHETLGFHVIGVRQKIGKMNGIWRDTLLLERRSLTIGID